MCVFSIRKINNRKSCNIINFYKKLNNSISYTNQYQYYYTSKLLLTKNAFI